MNRREFLRNMACVAIGSATLTEQIDALERIYLVNTPLIEKGLIHIDDIMLSGYANWSCPLTLNINFGDSLDELNFGMNAFGGVLRWVGTPEGRINCAEKNLKYEIIEHFPRPKGMDKSLIAVGWIKFTDQTLKRRTMEIKL